MLLHQETSPLAEGRNFAQSSTWFLAWAVLLQCWLLLLSEWSPQAARHQQGWQRAAGGHERWQGEKLVQQAVLRAQQD